MKIYKFKILIVQFYEYTEKNYTKYLHNIQNKNFEIVSNEKCFHILYS